MLLEEENGVVEVGRVKDLVAWVSTSRKGGVTCVAGFSGTEGKDYMPLAAIEGRRILLDWSLYYFVLGR